MLGDCASVATLCHDRFSERSYLFTMSDNTPAHQASRPDGAGERRSLRTSSRLGWWSQTDSNRRPPACKAGALTTELWPLQITEASIRGRTCAPDHQYLIPESGGLGRFELPTSRLSSARSNQLSYKPLGQETVISRRKSM